MKVRGVWFVSSTPTDVLSHRVSFLADVGQLLGEMEGYNGRIESRFLKDFMFRFSPIDFKDLKSHFATSRCGWGSRRKLPFAFNGQIGCVQDARQA